MNFRKMTMEDISACIPMVMDAYLEEQKSLHCLPDKLNESYFLKMIESIVDHDLAYIAYENEQILGFMGGYGPINEYFGLSKGVYVPTHGHGTLKNNKEYIHQSLLTYALNEWAIRGLLSVTVTVFYHDQLLKDLYMMNGYGGRCLDLMTKMEHVAIQHEKLDAGYELCHVTYDQLDEILPMKNKLVEHLAVSPVFFPTPFYDLDQFIKKSEKRKSNFYGLRYQGSLIGYIEYMKDGEHFASYDHACVNICGAYLAKAHRGKGLYQALLNYSANMEAKRGFTLVGVDCETLNTTARRFWMKDFTPYTISLARRIDEHILKENDHEAS